NAGFLNVILNSESISDAITKTFAASKLVNANNDLMKQQEQDKKDVETKKTDSETKLAELTKNAQTLEAKKGELVDQELAQTALMNQIAAEKETEQGKKNEFLAKQKEAEEQRAEQERLAKLAEEQAKVAAAKTETPDTATTPDTSSNNGNKDRKSTRLNS